MGNVRVDFVVSSGKGLGFMYCPRKWKVQELKQHLKQVDRGVYSEEFLALPKTLLPSLRLFISNRTEPPDTQPIHRIPQPVCLLQTSDLPLSLISLSGKPKMTIFNSENWTNWPISQSKKDKKTEIMLIYGDFEVCLCEIMETDMVKTLKKRFLKGINRRNREINVWFQGKLLEDVCTLNYCGISHKSRVFIQFSGELLGKTVDLMGKSLVFPVILPINKEKIAKMMKFTESDWANFGIYEEYICLNPLNSSISHFFFISNSSISSLLRISSSTNPSETSVLIPLNASISTIKQCLARQHGLLTSCMSLTCSGELGMGMSFSDYLPEQGESMVVIKEVDTNRQLTAVIYYGDMMITSRFFNTKDTIGEFKAKMDQDIGWRLMRGSEVLDEGKTFRECGIVTDTALTRVQTIPVPVLDFQVTVITPTSVLRLPCPVSTVTSQFQTLLHSLVCEPHFQLYIHAQELHPHLTLVEQGVTPWTYILLIPPTGRWVHVCTPYGTLYPVVIKPNTDLMTLAKVLEALGDLHSFRLIFTRKFRNEEEIFPVAGEKMMIKMEFGRGKRGKWTLKSGLGVDVEGNAEEEIEEMMRNCGIEGSFSSY